MKKITIYLIAIIFATAIFSCNEKSNEELIIGTWDESGNVHTFKADGSWSFTSLINFEGSWEIKDKHLITHSTGNTSDWGEIISIDDKTMVLNSIQRGEKVSYSKVQ